MDRSLQVIANIGYENPKAPYLAKFISIKCAPIDQSRIILIL